MQRVRVTPLNVHTLLCMRFYTDIMYATDATQLTLCRVCGFSDIIHGCVPLVHQIAKSGRFCRHWRTKFSIPMIRKSKKAAWIMTWHQELPTSPKSGSVALNSSRGPSETERTTLNVMPRRLGARLCKDATCCRRVQRWVLEGYHKVTWLAGPMSV